MRATESGENPRPGRAPPSAIDREGAGRAPRRPRTGQRRRRLAARHRRGDIRGGSRLLRGVRRQAGPRRGNGPQPGGPAACAHCPRRCRALSSRLEPARRGEHEPLSVEEISRGVEHLERPGRERHPMLAARLHALGRNRPRRPVAVESICSHRALRTSPEHAALGCATRLEALSCRVRCPVGLWARGARAWAGGGQRGSPSCSVGAMARSLPLPRCRSIRNVGSGKGCPPYGANSHATKVLDHGWSSRAPSARRGGAPRGSPGRA